MIENQVNDHWGFFVDIEKVKIQSLDINNNKNNNYTKINNNIVINNNDNDKINIIHQKEEDDDDNWNIIPKLIAITQIITTLFIISSICYVLLITL